jgi:hypothetical protein
MNPAPAAPGAVVPAGGTQPAAQAPGAPAPAHTPASSAAPLAKFIAKPKVSASEMQIAWRNRIAYLPDPSHNGAMGPGLVGQMFLFGGPKLEFALADGTLTVDLLDETPRPAGQPGAKPERWQFDKNTLRSLKTADETFGKSYVLFLPWPAYRPDITKVRIAARYDPDTGHTLYAAPTVVSLDHTTPFGAPVWDGSTTTITPGRGAGPLVDRPQLPLSAAPPIPMGGSAPNPAALAPGFAPIPLGGGSAHGGAPPVPSQPIAPSAPPTTLPIMPAGTMPLGPASMEPLSPIAITVGQK